MKSTQKQLKLVNLITHNWIHKISAGNNYAFNHRQYIK